MDTDYSQSDMSRLTTMLTNVGEPFERGTAAGAVRTVELLGVVFWFVRDGTLERVTRLEPERQLEPPAQQGKTQGQ